MKENSTHPFSADRPISTIDEDRLDREKFVKQFSERQRGQPLTCDILLAIGGKCEACLVSRADPLYLCAGAVTLTLAAQQ